MKKVFAIIIAMALIIALVPATIASAGKGNMAPSGPHYNLNIIGIKHDKNEEFDGGNGHRIFVDLTGKCNISLAEGDFAVLDADGTDGKAQFQLPNPDPENTGTSEYSVYARALGKPGGKANMTSGAYEWIDDNGDGIVQESELYVRMSVISLSLNRSNGKQVFSNVTKELLYLYVDLDGNGTAERYNLFNDALQDYFWEYDNQGLKLCQLRFYPGVTTEVPESY